MGAPHTNDDPILSVGTRITTLVEVKGTDGKAVHPRGAVGVVLRSPNDPLQPYRVRFLDGFEGVFPRAELSVLAHYKQGAVQDEQSPAREHDLYQYVIFRCVTGSQAYGLAGEASDVDRRGIYLPPAAFHWSLCGVPEQLEDPVTDQVYWEFQKFLTLALKANPNVLECLYTPLIEHAAPLAEELLAMRDSFLTRMVYQTYSGYVMSQFKKLEGDLRNHGRIRWKHAMHLIRLLLSGITVLREGFVPVQVGQYRDRLLAIKRGEMSWDDVAAWRLELYKQLDIAFEHTRLPERPDYEEANALLIRARLSMASRESAR